MPIYQYECKGCGETGDYLVGMGKKPYQCFNCHSEGPFKRVISGETPSVSSSKSESEPKGIPPCVSSALNALSLVNLVMNAGQVLEKHHNRQSFKRASKLNPN